MIKGIVFDIKKYAIHDGAGIRTTVFFKGCPMRCWWCHNPESQKFESEIMIFKRNCLSECNLCVEVCKKGAMKREESLLIEKKKCDFCGECQEICPSEAIKISGKEVTVDDIMNEIDKGILFYDESGGGVTFSGGEPFAQIDFLNALLLASEERYLKTVVDTSGYTDFKSFEKINSLVDHYFYDLKLMDDSLHRKYTGVSNRIILENLKKLSEIHDNIEIRIPLIEGITDTDENISSILDFLSELKNISQISLLNYHKGGISKYRRLGIQYRLSDIEPLSDERLKSIKSKFSKLEVNIKIRG